LPKHRNSKESYFNNPFAPALIEHGLSQQNDINQLGSAKRGGTETIGCHLIGAAAGI